MYITSQSRLEQFIALYEKYYTVKLSLEEGERIFSALLGLLHAVRQGDNFASQEEIEGRHNNAAPVIDIKIAEIHDK